MSGVSVERGSVGVEERFLVLSLVIEDRIEVLGI